MITFSFSKQALSGGVAVVRGRHNETELVTRSNGERVIELGKQELKNLTIKKYIRLIRKITQMALSKKVSILTLNFDELYFKELKLSREKAAEIIASNIVLANYKHVTYKTAPKEGWPAIETVHVIATDKKTQNGFSRGQIIGDEINACREIANMPGGEMTPQILADHARTAVRGTPITVKVLGVPEMKKLGMGAILGVGKGSDAEPKFIIMEYDGAAGKPIVLVGKGVTFDTGGLNLKPSSGIYEMHMDMSGAAAVIHTIVAAAKLRVKKKIVALVPAVENMPSGSSYRPGDVLKSMGGPTIEILNTDAEGRVILTDALTYAERYKPSVVIDVATLTGAAITALGTKANAVLSKDAQLVKRLIAAGEVTGDPLWELPLWDEYEADIKGTFGDWANTGKSGQAGTIAGGIFLYQWAKNYRWAHIDMAPRMTASDGECLAKGAMGSPVALLIEYVRS